MWIKSNLTIPAVAAISFCLIGGTTPAYADLGDQLFKLLPDDGAAIDLFGWSIAISGTTAIFGAFGDDNGSAYLFDISDSANPTQLFELVPNDGASGDHFGISVAISGTTAIVGSGNDDDNCEDSGSAYLFDTTTGCQLFKLLPDDGETFDHFGISVAISGPAGKELAIVGAWGTSTGSAYLFDAATGRQITELLADDGGLGDSFGVSVAISGATAIVGAPGHDDKGSSSGSGYLFDISDPANPTQLFKLLPDDGAADDFFGISVAISGATAIVGAIFDDDNGSDSGSAYLFDTTTGRQLFKLLPDDGAVNDRFGYSVAISGTTAIVGAYHDDDHGNDSGSAYLFDTTTGQQIVKLLPNDGAEGDEFGISVAIAGAPGKEVAIVGAYRDDDNGTDSGSAYLFDAAACPWDLDDSGSVGASDLLALLANWGPCKGCPADFDGDGTVGASDLLALLANWGPCP